MVYQTPKVIAWKTAEHAARTVEVEICSLLLTRAKRVTPDGIEQKMAVASCLRRAAHERLQEALAEIEFAAAALRYRNSVGADSKVSAHFSVGANSRADCSTTCS